MNVLKKNKDAPEKILCGLNPGHVNFVENILDLEETEDTQEKITCTGNSALTNFVENVWMLKI